MKLPCTLKLRHTGSSNGGRGGEGAMVTENLSCTLAASVQDQTLITRGHCAIYDGYNPQGGEMNPCDEELGETRAVCPQNGVMQMKQEAVGFKYKQGEKSQKPFAENGEAQALSAVCHDSAVAVGFKAEQSKDGSLGDEREVAPTLSHAPSALEPTVAQSQYGNIAGTLERRADSSPCVDRGQNIVAQSGVQCLTPEHPISHRVYHESGAYPTVRANNGGGQDQQAVLQMLSYMRYIVRRLTPTECERLMGLPDGYTIPVGLQITDELVAEFQRIHDNFNAIMYDYAMSAYERNHRFGEPPPKPPKPKAAKQVRAWLEKITDPATCPDSPRYKVCGNGWATNQPRWILTRLLVADGIDPFEEGGAK